MAMASLNIFTFFLLLLLFISPTKSVQENILDPQASENVKQDEASSSAIGTYPLAVPQASKPPKNPQRSEIVELDEGNSVEGTPPWADPQASENAEDNRLKVEMAAVGDNISALYIVRKIAERTKSLITANTNANVNMMYELKLELHSNPDEIVSALENELRNANTKFLQKKNTNVPVIDDPVQQQVANAKRAKRLADKVAAVNELKEKLAKARKDKLMYDFWMRKMNESKLPDKEINKLKDELAGILKEANKVVNYLNEVNTHIVEFREQQRKTKDRDARLAVTERNKISICHTLWTEHVDFLEQIRLEVQLHDEFRLKPEADLHHELENKGLPASVIFDYKDHEAFMENAKILAKMYEKVVKKGKWFRKMLNCVIPEKQKKVVDEHPYKVMLNINNAAKNVYMDIVKLIEWPFKNEKKFVRYIFDVASVAENEGGATGMYVHELHKHSEIVNAKTYLERLFNMYEDVQSMWQSLPTTWQTDLDGKICYKIEMPWKWYTEMHAKAYPNIQGKFKPAEEMVQMRVKLLLAKTLLVYERLDMFYKIDAYYKVWKEEESRKLKRINAPKNGENIDGNEMPSLLKYYFEKFEKKKWIAAWVPSESAVYD